MIGLGMWSWRQTAFNTIETRRKLLAFCAQEGIAHVDQHVDINEEGKVHSVQNADSLRTLIIEAAKQSVTVSALRGASHMLLERNHDRALLDLRAIIEFDKLLPSSAYLTGVKYDVEPHGTKEWQAGGKQREKVILDYLSFLKIAKPLLNKEAPHLELSVDVPFWWDRPEFRVYFNDSNKLLVHHVQDLTDYIGVMSYRTKARQVIDLVEQEMAYAKKIGKTICLGLETANIKGNESSISFWSHNPALFRKSVEELKEVLSGNNVVRLIMLHHYSSLVEYLGITPN